MRFLATDRKVGNARIPFWVCFSEQSAAVPGELRDLRLCIAEASSHLKTQRPPRTAAKDAEETEGLLRKIGTLAKSFVVQTIPFRYTSKARLTLIPNDESNIGPEVALKWDF
jgi:hypothetical protein